MITPGSLYKNRNLGNIVRIISASDTYVEAEDVETFELFEMSMTSFEQEFKECI